MLSLQARRCSGHRRIQRAEATTLEIGRNLLIPRLSSLVAAGCLRAVGTASPHCFCICIYWVAIGTYTVATGFVGFRYGSPVPTWMQSKAAAWALIASSDMSSLTPRFQRAHHCEHNERRRNLYKSKCAADQLLTAIITARTTKRFCTTRSDGISMRAECSKEK